MADNMTSSIPYLWKCRPLEEGTLVLTGISNGYSYASFGWNLLMLTQD